MPRKWHSEEQVVYALRQIEGGKKVSEVCREMGVSPQPVYRWKRRYSGLGLNEVRELRQLREENRKLKGIVFGYACHCTVLDVYKFCGDYAGSAKL